MVVMGDRGENKPVGFAGGRIARGVRTALLVGLIAVSVSADPSVLSDDGLKELHALEEVFVRLVPRLRPAAVTIMGYRSRPGEAARHERTLVNRGSGFVLSRDGWIATHQHVLEGADRFVVLLADGSRHPVIETRFDRRMDLAVVRIEADGLRPAMLEDGHRLRPGRWLLALGNPLGFSETDGQAALAVGVVSAVGRSLTGRFGPQYDDRIYEGLLQTTLDLPPGSSGGPVFDLEGHVVGLATATFAADDETPGVGFVLPIGPGVRSVLRRLMGESAAPGPQTDSSPCPQDRNEEYTTSALSAREDMKR
ncbi:MAG: hypothetical protein D6788_08415 [Planctomycetota bacterium]|nr:MAG: hypothetical protein D6788_08415 [Planctomycetota bacterium]